MNPGDLVRITQERSRYGAVALYDDRTVFYDVYPHFLMTYVKRERNADVVLFQGTFLHIASGVLEKVET